MYGLRLVIAATVAGAASGAVAEISPRQVLLVYDSANADSALVAEHYAGSAKVPGGVGGVAGARPAVFVLDLASVGGGGLSATPTITHTQFIAEYRDPIRLHLAAEGLGEQIRSIVLTKGIPHRIADTDSGAAGDSPTVSLTEWQDNRDATYGALDSELTLLWQNLADTENGNAADSRADGFILNPYHQRSSPINGFPSAVITTAKSFSGVPGFSTGQGWRAISSLPRNRLAPGDIYLVCRLDGHTVDDVRAMIDRAQGAIVDTDAAVLILDESNHGGTNPEFDDDGPAATNSGDDYELARDAALADGRFPAGNVRYNITAFAAGFSVGPLISFGGQGLLVNEPVSLLAHEGANHNGIPTGGAGSLYAASFNYAPGAVFNTIESFNGRDFGGIGPGGIVQEQAADFIAAGGTFAIGTVYEPFSFTIGDNEFLIRNFLTGALSWGEAAYTAFPTLSWQTLVIGDPLARITRTSDDVNGDGVVDIEDVYAWEAAPTDVNNDGMTNSIDRDHIETSIRAVDAAGMAALRR